MKKILFLCLMCVCQLALFGQGTNGDDGTYDPSNPGNPDSPEGTYLLKTAVTPSNAAYSGLSVGQRVASGSSVYVYSYPNTNYRFVKWLQADSVVSTSQSFSYTMPGRNVTLTAVYVYDPSSPSNPDSVGSQHLLSTMSVPSQGGSFNFGTSLLAENSTINVYAYNNSNYKFKGWRIGDSLVSTSSPYSFTMGRQNTTIVGLYEFDPSNPSNPGKNSWNASTGALIIDDFSSVNLMSAIDDAIGGYGNRSKVTMLTVSGKMSYYDFGFANSLPNCVVFDLSRTYGYAEIPSYAFDGMNLTTINLPSCIEKIGYCAFCNCKNLTAVTSYAVTPPSLENDAFSGISEGAVLHVLSSSIALYSVADGWKNFTSLPLSEEVGSLEVDLPEGSSDDRYKNMTLEIVNTASGQKYRYVISDRVVYTFNGLIKGTKYNVYLKNQSETVLGEISQVTIGDGGLKVVFDKVITPQTVTLKVVTPKGNDVTSQTQITWTNSVGTYLTQGVSVSGVIPTSVLKYHVNIGQTLGQQYLIPLVQEYTVIEGVNSPVSRLSPIDTLTVSGVVKNINGSVLSGAVVTISQRLNGKYYKTVTMKTNANGVYSANVYRQPTTVTISAADCVSKTVSYDSLQRANLGTALLKSITGATVSIGLSYTKSALKDSIPETQNWYADYANVAYSIYDVTKSKAITEYNVQYPSIVLLEEVDEQDQLKITATSKNNSFLPVSGMAVIDSVNHARVSLPIVQLGAIRATFKQTENTSVIGLLYGSDGLLVKKYTYSNATLDISSLPDGTYTLVTMSESSLFNGIMRLNQFASSGLSQGIDYVENTVSVKSGLISSIVNSVVPKLDESKLYYTGSNTSFTVNKTSIISGNYLTMKGRIDFKDAYNSGVSGVNMVVDLPASASFVDNSVMVGSKVSSYILDGTRLTVPVTNLSDEVRFCVLPTVGGDYIPNAYAKFTLGGKIIQQPIGTAPYTVKDLSITVPATVAKTTIPVTGVAAANSQVDIYDNGMMIGSTKSLANGSWSASCELINAYNLSVHQIYAKVTTSKGLQLQSETQDITYDINAIEVSSVTMVNTAHGSGSLDLMEYKTVFDFANPQAKMPAYWYWPSYPDFTFIVDFTNNDTTKVSNVHLHVKTTNSSLVKLTPVYNAKIDKWVASAPFYSYALPTNVSVTYDVNKESYIDESNLKNALTSLQSFQSNLASSVNNVDSIAALLLNRYDGDSIDQLQIQQLKDELSGYINVDWTKASSIGQDITDEKIAALITECDKLLNDSSYTSYKKILQAKMSDINNLSAYFKGVTVTSCSTIDTARLVVEGYGKLTTTTGERIYYRLQSDSMSFIYPSKNLHISVCLNDSTGTSPLKANSSDSFLNRMSIINDGIKKGCENLKGLVDAVVYAIESTTESLVAANSKLTDRLLDIDNQIRYLEKSSKDIAKLEKLRSEFKLIAKAIRGNHTIIQWLDENVNSYTVSKGTGKAFAIFDLLYNAYQMTGNLQKVIALYKSIPNPCPKEQSESDDIRGGTVALGLQTGAFYLSQIALDIVQITGISSGIFATVPTGWASLVAVGVSFGIAAANFFAGQIYDKAYDKNLTSLTYRKDKLDCDGGGGDDGGNGGNGNAFGVSGCADVPNVQDPSGYVYEAVSSNRVEGVTATAYYKETVEDMYGDKHENIVLWDAAEYAQENPLFTDANGMYAWDVPKGLWQVKFEKEGYQTTYSEWLPVPPPQLDVNISMIQNTQPAVKSARAYEEGIDVEFDKYMLPESLTADQIIVTKNGRKITGKITLTNSESTYSGSSVSYASKVRFVPDTTFLSTDEITLVVSKQVKSYSGIQMQDDYSQSFDIVKEIKRIVADSIVNILCNGDKEIVVSVLPYDAGIGKKLIAKSSSSLISTITPEAVLDKNGQAKLTVTGELPGKSVISYMIEDADVSTTSVIHVVNRIEGSVTAMPTSSRISGTELYRNTTVSFNCSDKGAQIYYTTDGSCPCDVAGTRKLYTSPLVIDSSMTIKMLAVAGTKCESEVATFVYKVKTSSIAMNLKKGWTWISYPLQSKFHPVNIANAHALRFVGKDAECVYNPQTGITGNLA